jgi:MFS family permease
VLCSFLENMSFSLINPFFPPFAIDRGVPQFYVGLIISANPIGAFVASLIIGKILNEVHPVITRTSETGSC